MNRPIQTAKSAALVICGLASRARRQFSGQGAVLAFHGVRQDGQPAEVTDESLHLPVSVFRAICEHLAKNYQVMPLSKMGALLRQGAFLPPHAVGLSFDDGYASNYELAFPVLRELKLPATIFLTSGFLDGTVPLWFQEVDLALRRGAQSPWNLPLGETLARLKTLPDPEMRAHVAALTLQVVATAAAPPVTRPLKWAQAREMSNSGLIEMGAHTHSHPVLSRCSLEAQRREIETCRNRLTDELGLAPRLFAFPNGGVQDYTSQTQALLEEAGFESAWTMVSGQVAVGSPPLHLPRYGAPTSVWEAEATVSGAFELLRRWRGGGG